MARRAGHRSAEGGCLIARLGKTQKKIIEYMKSQGGVHVYMGATIKSLKGREFLGGYFWEEIERSLTSLIKRGLVIKVKSGFYTTPGREEKSELCES